MSDIRSFFGGPPAPRKEQVEVRFEEEVAVEACVKPGPPSSGHKRALSSISNVSCASSSATSLTTEDRKLLAAAKRQKAAKARKQEAKDSRPISAELLQWQ